MGFPGAFSGRYVSYSITTARNGVRRGMCALRIHITNVVHRFLCLPGKMVGNLSAALSCATL